MTKKEIMAKAPKISGRRRRAKIMLLLVTIT
jgi:hypothetical protein